MVPYRSSYKSVHKKLTYWYGAAKTLRCVECHQPAKDWAYQGGSPTEKIDPDVDMYYTDDMTYYKPMCKKCHSKMDWSWMTECTKGHKFDDANTYFYKGRRYCRQCRKRNQQDWRDGRHA